MKIEEARKQKNMSRRELSEWLEIPYRTLTNWENGERSCPDYIEIRLYKLQGTADDHDHRLRLLL